MSRSNALGHLSGDAKAWRKDGVGFSSSRTTARRPRNSRILSTTVSCGGSGEYAVMTIDRMLPDIDGLTVIRRLIVSALGEIDDRMRGLRSGGEVYLAEWLDASGAT